MLYGAYGTTGLLILDEAVRRGHRPLLAGRDPVRLSTLADRYGLESVPLDLAQATSDPLKGASIVVNAAGPFFETGAPVRELCLQAGASYVDVNGEIGDFVHALGCDARARAQRVAVIPGAGFAVVLGEALAAHVARRLPDAAWMRISLAAATGSSSRGALRSGASVLAQGGYAISGGELRPRSMAFRTWHLPSHDPNSGNVRFAAVPRAELVAAHRLTGVREIVTGIPLSLPAAYALRITGRVAGALMLRRRGTASSTSEASPQESCAAHRSHVWVEAGNDAGDRVMSRLETGEGYRLAASAAVHAVEGVLAAGPVGALTPAQAFGPGFALALPATRIIDV